MWPLSGKNESGKRGSKASRSTAPADDPDRLWRAFLAQGPDIDDLFQCLKTFRFHPLIRTNAARALVDTYGPRLTIDQLNTIISYVADEPIGVEVGHMVLERATTKDELAQVLLSIPGLQVVAARRTLALNPEQVDLLRCLRIPEVAEEAIRLLLQSDPSRDTLLFLLRFGHNRGYITAVMTAVHEYVRSKKVRVTHTPAMQAILDALAPERKTVH